MDSAELTAILEEVRERVRARHPESGNGPLPDLLPLLHARDAAEAKVAAIGTVNPRQGGPLNGIIQQFKKWIARALDWHVREQVEFNRNVMACVQATLEALEEIKGAFSVAQELQDLRAHWIEWHQGWEQKLNIHETKLLRGLAELNSAFLHQTSQMEGHFRESMAKQHLEFTAALANGLQEIQKSIRADYDRVIHTELRLIRQRLAAGSAPAPGHEAGAALPPPTAAPSFDYTRFAERFRGSEEYVKQSQRFYLPYFAGCREVLDIGCGRGEFLELMREAGVSARGIDLGAESVELCRQKGLRADAADLFAYLAALPEWSLDGIFCAQVVEHLPPDRLPEMIRLAASRLERGGVLLIETPNPECLAIFATHFYLDPTHTRPVPHPLLGFYMEEYGMGSIEVHRRSPAIDSMPALASLPADFREAFFGGLDYAIAGRKL